MFFKHENRAHFQSLFVLLLQRLCRFEIFLLNLLMRHQSSSLGSDLRVVVMTIIEFLLVAWNVLLK